MTGVLEQTGLQGALHKYSLWRIRRAVKVFVLGNHKTGSTVIGAALGEMSGMPVTLDIRGAIRNPEWKVLLSQGVGTFDGFLHRNRKEFMLPIIKDPGLTLFYDELAARFPDARYVMIVRNPLDNIRSILNRLQVPGSCEELSFGDYPALARSRAWQINLRGDWLGLASDHYIDVLSARWDRAARLYLRQPEKFSLLRYEDFLADKNGRIERLCADLHLPVRNSASSVVERQFQSAGEVVEDFAVFYGQRNMDRIISSCAESAERLGYKLT